MSHQTVDQEIIHNHIMFGSLQSDCKYLRAQFEKGSSLNPKSYKPIHYHDQDAEWIYIAESMKSY